MTDTTSPGTPADPHAGLILERMTLEPAGKPLRAVFGGETVAESDHALVLAETGYPPHYALCQLSPLLSLIEPKTLSFERRCARGHMEN